jgi:hypothetical protein
LKAVAQKQDRLRFLDAQIRDLEVKYLKGAITSEAAPGRYDEALVRDRVRGYLAASVELFGDTPPVKRPPAKPAGRTRR